ncbi:hypothetical protein ABEB36_005283 [Hypothenemus hampei]|uniref:NACHT domain-containing protein n=1 Tax=Hypothenemus hampei TaxID=57062 RepID=A0ABD1EXN7_HYPHA
MDRLSTKRCEKNCISSSDEERSCKKVKKDEVKKYTASGLKYSLHGTVYQLQLLMFYLHRAVSKFQDFDMATEMDQADKFDDVVLRYKKVDSSSWHWTFLQAKHKIDTARDMVTVTALTHPDGEFSLSKYFVSFFRIKTNPDFANDHLADFILCTNTKLDFSESNKHKKDNTPTQTANKYNENIRKWKTCFVKDTLEKESVLYCDEFKSVSVHKLHDTAFKQFLSLIWNNLLAASENSKLIDDLDLVRQSLVYVGIVANKFRILSVTEEIQNVNEKSTKEILKNLATTVLSLEKEFKGAKKNKKLYGYKNTILGIDFSAFADAYQIFNAPRSQHKSQVVTELKNIGSCINQALLKAEDFLKRNCSDALLKIKKLQEDISSLRTMIMQCSDSEQLEKILQSFPAYKELLSNKCLNEFQEIIKNPHLSIETCKRTILEELGVAISELLIIQVTLNLPTLESYLNEFFEKFRLVTEYPNVDELNILIKQEFREKFHLIDADLLTDSFERQVLEWFVEFNKGRSTVLSKERGDLFFESLRKQMVSLLVAGIHKQYLEKLQNYNLRFQNSRNPVDDFFDSEEQILHVSTHSTTLGTYKVLQKVELLDQYKYQDSFICLPSSDFSIRKTRHVVTEAFSYPNKFSLIVIDCRMYSFDNNDFVEACDSLLFSLNLFPNKKIVFVSSKKRSLLKDLKRLTLKTLNGYSDSTNFDQLTNNSKNMILNKTVCLQNKNVPLNNLLDHHSAQFVFDEMSLQKFMEEDLIQLGDNNAFSCVGYNSDIYIPRHLFMQRLNNTVFTVKNCLFLVENITREHLLKLDIRNDVVLLPWDTRKLVIGNIILPPTSDDAEYIYKQLLEHYSHFTIIWLKYLEDSFGWNKCSGMFTEIEKCLDQQFNYQCPESLSNEDSIARLDTNQKIFILATNPGMGKSTFITSLATKVKHFNTHFWVLKINLNDHAFDRQLLTEGDYRRNTKSLKEVPENLTIPEAVNILCDMAVWLNPSRDLQDFQKTLFKLGLNGTKVSARTPKIVLFFDGFDEISPTYKENTIRLLKALQETEVHKIWTTTRVHLKEFLQQELLSPAYILNVFNEIDQIEFLNKFWRWSVKSKMEDLQIEKQHKYLQDIIHKTDPAKSNDQIEINDILNNLDFQNFAKDLINQWDSVNFRQQNFTQVPLHLKMLAEVVFDNDFKLPENIGLTNLFDDFIENKFKIYYYGKNILVGNVLSDDVREGHSMLLRKDHSLLALSVLFPTKMWPQPANRTLILARVGLVITYDVRIDFVHRSFAEFFLADFLIHNLHSLEIQELLLRTILVEKQYLLATLFFDENLINHPNNDIVFSSTLLNEIASAPLYGNTFLHGLLELGHLNVIRFFTKKLYDHQEVAENILFKVGKFGTTPIYNLVYNPRNPLRETFVVNVLRVFFDALRNEHIVRSLTHYFHEILVLINGICPKITVLQVSLCNKRFNVAVFFLQYILERGLFMDIFMKNGFEGDGTLLHFCAKWSNKDSVMLVFNFLSSKDEFGSWKIPLQNLIEILSAKDSKGHTYLHLLVWYKKSELLASYLNWLKIQVENDVTMKDVIKLLLYLLDNRGFTPLAISVLREDDTSTNILLTFIKNEQYLSEEDIYNQEYDRCILSKAIMEGKSSIVEMLLTRYKDYYYPSSSNFWHQLLKTSKLSYGRTSLTLAAARGFLQTIQIVFKWLENNLNLDDFNDFVINLMHHRDFNNMNTILAEAVNWKQEEVVKFLLDIIEEKLDLKSQIIILFVFRKWEETLLDITYRDFSENIIKMLMERYQLIFARIMSLSCDKTMLSSNFTNQSLTNVKDFLNKHKNDIDFIGEQMLDILNDIECQE